MSSQTPPQSPRSPESRKTRVAVVFGGRSSEHTISVVTAGAVRHLVPGHDPGTLAMLTPYGAPLEGDAAVIGRLA